MNAPILASQWPTARFTVAQIWALIERGVIDADARFELIKGEIRDMSPKGPLHESVRRAVNRWIRTLPPALEDLAETTLYLDDANFVEPDYVLMRSDVKSADLKASDVLLAIEVADTSWDYDAGLKAGFYAAHGVQEYWVINAQSLVIRVHRAPSGSEWGDVGDVAAGMAIEALCAPGAPIVLK